MRLFLAIEPDAPARASIETLVADVRRSLGDAATLLRWTPAANVHITLHFLGEVDDDGAERLRAALAEPIRQPGFAVETGTLGLNPHRGPVRVLWLGLASGGDALAHLYDELSPRVQRAGMPTVRRPFQPHLTLGRVRERDRSNPAARTLRTKVAAYSGIPIVWRVDHVTLFQSELSQSAPRYTPLATAALAPPAAGLPRGTASGGTTP